MAPAYEYRSITGGLLRQTVDRGDPDAARWRVVTQAQPQRGRHARAAIRLEGLPTRTQ
ncbi:MAG: hypothetical protein KatS3mg052_2298 [Candidatus Roseilinea sp.]|nr:MAG: hypothetical protein KatS3mg052_2298 [Candidatus Roseilinea sp.]